MPRGVQLHTAGMKELLHSAGVRAFLHAEGEQVAARARASAPYDSSPDRPAVYGNGDPNVHFRDSFVVQDATTDRAVCRIATTDPKGAIKEAKFRTLTRALDG